MTTKRIVYTRPDGGVSIVIPAPRFIAMLIDSGATEDQAMAEVRLRDVPSDAANVEVMETALLPSSREFRDAWEQSPSGVVINPIKAQEILNRRAKTATPVTPA